MNKILRIFIGFFVAMFLGSLLLVLVALTGSSVLTYSLVGVLVAISFGFLLSTNIFAQE